MARIDRTIRRILSGSSDHNIPFRDLRRILERFGFSLRIHGSHHIFFKEGVDEILNLQPKGAKSKAYQVKQVRDLITKYRLVETDEE